MKTSVPREWLVQYVLPTLLLVASLAFLILIMDDPDIVWGLVVAPPLAIVLGAVVRPDRVWVTPLAVALIVASSIVVAALLGQLDPPDPLPVQYFWATLFIGAPLAVWTWLGKQIGAVVQRRWRQEKSGRLPGSHAGA